MHSGVKLSIVRACKVRATQPRAEQGTGKAESCGVESRKGKVQLDSAMVKRSGVSATLSIEKFRQCVEW